MTRIWGALVLLGCGTVLAAEEKPATVFVGYVFGDTTPVDLKLYTHVCHAFLALDGEGRIEPHRGVPSAEFARRAHAAGVKVLLSVGGWGWDQQFRSFSGRDETLTRAVAVMLDAVDKADYDGIDLDWEYPDTRADVAGFESLTRRLRAGLDEQGKRKGRPMLLTMAASSNPGTFRWLETKFLVENMDWVNVMTYDMAGDWTPYAGHHAPLYPSSKAPSGNKLSTATTMRYLLDERHLPASKIALGIPLYGRGFGVGKPYESTKGAKSPRRGESTFTALERLREDQGWTREWDDETKTPWLLAPDRSSVVGYEDPESAALKAGWARRHDLRGVFFWHATADRVPNGAHPVQEAARKALFE